MKKIWITHHYALPPQYETRVRNNMMSKYLIKKGYDIKIFSASTVHNTDINLIDKNDKNFIEKSYDDLNFVHIKTLNYNDNGFKRIINMLQFPIKLYRIGLKFYEKPDLIICDRIIEAIGVYPLARKLKKPFILEIRDLWPLSIVEYTKYTNKNLIIKLMYLWEKWIYKKSDALIFTMEGGKDYIVNKKWDKDIDLSKIYYINNGVDLKQYYFNRDNYQIEDIDLNEKDTFKVLYTGSIRKANNLKKIIDVAEVLYKMGNKNIKFLIYGDGNEKEMLIKYCKNNNLDNIIFKGYVDKKFIPYILSKSNLNIVYFNENKLKKYGPSMNKLFDYLASGKPSISDCRFGYDIFEKYGCGISIDNATPKEMANGILKFYNMSKKEYDKYSENALNAAKEFDFEVLTDKLESVIIKTLDKYNSNNRG